MIPATLALMFTTTGAPKELGDVRWSRDLDAAIADAERLERPLLILFDEVPGCSTCVSYGQNVLKNPLLLEAAETLFVPVAVFNNLGGKDREALDAFKEPSWNNPVVRIVDARRNPLAPRLDGDYTQVGLARSMVAALQRAGKVV